MNIVGTQNTANVEAVREPKREKENLYGFLNTVMLHWIGDCLPNLPPQTDMMLPWRKSLTCTVSRVKQVKFDIDV